MGEDEWLERRLERVESTLRMVLRRLGVDEKDILRLEREVERPRYPRTTAIKVAPS